MIDDVDNRAADALFDPHFDYATGKRHLGFNGSADYERDWNKEDAENDAIDAAGMDPVAPEPHSPRAKYCRGCSQPKCEWNSNFCADCLQESRGATLGGAPLGGI